MIAGTFGIGLTGAAANRIGSRSGQGCVGGCRCTSCGWCARGNRSVGRLDKGTAISGAGSVVIHTDSKDANTGIAEVIVGTLGVCLAGAATLRIRRCRWRGRPGGGRCTS